MIYHATIKTLKTNQTASTEIEAENLEQAVILVNQKIQGFAVLVSLVVEWASEVKPLKQARGKKYARWATPRFSF